MYMIHLHSKAQLPILRKGIFDYFMINQNLKMFNIGNFYQIIAGLDLFDKNYIKTQFESNRSNYNTYWLNESKTINDTVEYVIPHKKFIELVNYNYLKNKV